MNKEININTRRRLFSTNVVTLLVGIVMVLVFGGSSVQAQTSTETTQPPDVESSITIPVKGTVSDPGGSITVSGNVIVTAKRVIDNTSPSASPIVVLDLDFSKLTGTSGSLKTLTTYVTGDNHAEELRPLQTSDKIIVTCPYFENTKGALSARTMLVTATLNFDISTGKLTSGSIVIGNNVVNSTMVGGTSSL